MASSKASGKLQPGIKKSQRGIAAMGKHKNAYALYTGPTTRRRRNPVKVTVDPAAVAAAFARKDDPNAYRVVEPTTGTVSANPYQGLDAQHYSPVILPYSRSITR